MLISDPSLFYNVPYTASNSGSLPGDLVTVLQTGTSPFSKEKLQVRMLLTPTSLQFWKKAKKKLLGEAPLALCWTETEPQVEKKGKDADSHFRLGVIFPSQRWPLVVKSESERFKFLQKINDAIKSSLKLDHVPAGTLENRRGFIVTLSRTNVAFLGVFF